MNGINYMGSINCNITLEHPAESITSRLGRVLYVNGDAVNQRQQKTSGRYFYAASRVVPRTNSASAVLRDCGGFFVVSLRLYCLCTSYQ